MLLNLVVNSGMFGINTKPRFVPQRGVVSFICSLVCHTRTWRRRWMKPKRKKSRPHQEQSWNEWKDRRLDTKERRAYCEYNNQHFILDCGPIGLSVVGDHPYGRFPVDRGSQRLSRTERTGLVRGRYFTVEERKRKEILNHLIAIEPKVMNWLLMDIVVADVWHTGWSKSRTPSRAEMKHLPGKLNIAFSNTTYLNIIWRFSSTTIHCSNLYDLYCKMNHVSVFGKLLKSYPRRLKAANDTKGYHTHY